MAPKQNKKHLETRAQVRIQEMSMDERKLLVTFVWIAIAGIVFSLFCLIANGSGDHPESFQMYLLCSSIVLAAALLARAISSNRKG